MVMAKGGNHRGARQPERRSCEVEGGLPEMGISGPNAEGAAGGIGGACMLAKPNLGVFLTQQKKKKLFYVQEQLLSQAL